MTDIDSLRADERAKSMKPGIHPDMSAKTYYADPCPEPSLTQSIAKVLLDRSPAHAWLKHPRLGGKPDGDEGYDKAQAIGTAAHKLMLGRGKEVLILEYDNFRTKSAQADREKAVEEGYSPILARHHNIAKTMVTAARAQLDAAGLVDPFRVGGGEVAVIAEVDGLWCRSLIDWMVSTIELYDFKTSGKSANPYAVPYTMVDAGWDIQAAMQEHILDALDSGGAGRRRFRFVMQENEPPWALTVHELPESVMTMGRKKLQYAIDVWRRCMDDGEWPAYPPVISRPEYPGYMEQAWLNREIAMDEQRAVTAMTVCEFDPEVLRAG